MADHLRNTDIKIAKCPRCDTYVWACQSDGFKVMADIAPITTLDGYVSALQTGRGVYDRKELSGRPWRLSRRSRSSPPWTEGRNDIHADHACAAGINAQTVELVPVTPPQAPVTHGRPKAGPRQPTALAKPPQGRKTNTNRRPADTANPRPSEPERLTCDACGRRITPGQPHTAITHGSTVHWARHESCGNAESVLIRNAEWQTLVQLSRKGIPAWNRTIENLELPEMNDD
ncbi:hypothetical protein ACIRPT_02710 [Streptomyces sp. NPDC101227]|uniref:hypothetical protein n=1 Tax=Streptomyces sp. NPDC101227 TaxID=3366136 RepID=UPI003828624F